MKKATVCLTLAAVAVAASLSSCKRTAALFSPEDEDFHVESREALPPAADAAEWLKRFPQGLPSEQGYSELPPQAEWPAILKQIRKPGGDEKSIKGRLFGDILAEDDGAAGKSIRALLESNKDDLGGYSRAEALGYFYRFANDPAEARLWVEQSLPKAEPDSVMSSSEPEKFEVMLAENRIEEGIAALQTRIAAAEDGYDKSSYRARLAKVAHLTNRKPLYDKTVGEMTAEALATPVDEIYGRPYDTLDEVFRRKDWQMARKIATHSVKKESAVDFQPVFLTATYHLDGPAAFLAELRRCPEKGIAGPRTFAVLLMEDTAGDGIQLKEMVVRSYMAAGETENARATLAYLLALDMGNDALYRLAIEYFPEQAGAMFEALRPYNPYQERPLIWLAEIALGKKDLAKAQELIDQAIALDPSDGDQGKFTRMQVYDVLSRILRAKGDAKKADFFNEVMVSIRQGEEADDYLNAGLTQEAIRRYQEALGHFQDAYCLQSRLAKSLLKAG